MSVPHQPCVETSPAAFAAQGPLSEHSRMVQRVHRRYADWLTLLPDGPPSRDTLAQALEALQARGLALGAALRVTRQLLMARLAVLDCDQQADLAVVTRGVTELAELALDAAVTHARATLDELHGAPLRPNGGVDGGSAVAQVWVMGMGKLGARELNFSSDVDLIYVYGTDGETTGPSPITHFAYYARLAELVTEAIAKVYKRVAVRASNKTPTYIDLRHEALAAERDKRAR